MPEDGNVPTWPTCRGEGRWTARRHRPYSEASADYKVFTTANDEEIRAEDLAEPAELERLRAYLDQQLEPLKRSCVAAGQQAATSFAGATKPVVAVRS